MFSQVNQSKRTEKSNLDVYLIIYYYQIYKNSYVHNLNFCAVFIKDHLERVPVEIRTRIKHIINLCALFVVT